MMHDDSSRNQVFKKKNKRSFVQQQKRNAKRGRFGLGTDLTEDVFNYFIRIKEAMNANKDNVEEKKLLANQVFKEIEGEESKYSCNQMTSKIIEELIPLADDKELCKFIENLTRDLRPIFSNSFSSFVLQTLLITSYQKLVENINSDNKYNVKYHQLIMKIGKYSLNNIEEFAYDKFSNHIIRTTLNVLSGKAVKDEKQQPFQPSDDNCPKEFHDLLAEFANKVISWPTFYESMNTIVTSTLFQALLLATARVDKKLTKKIIKKLLGNSEIKGKDFVDEDNSPFVNLIETTLVVAKKKQYLKIYIEYFKENLELFLTSKVTNFAVQKLIVNCKDKILYEEIFDNLKDHLEDILSCGFTGIVLSLAQACNRLKAKQAEFIVVLMKVFQCSESEEQKLQIVPLICSMKPLDEYDTEAPVNLHGSLIVQELLHFDKPIKIINSFLEISLENFIRLLNDQRGCHITDAFFNGKFVGEKSRDRLFNKLKGHFITLAKSKHGSRSLDAIWNGISIKQKIVLMDELKSNQSELYNTPFSFMFAKKCNFAEFAKNRESWIKQQNTVNTVEKVFSDILPNKKS